MFHRATPLVQVQWSPCPSRKSWSIYFGTKHRLQRSDLPSTLSVVSCGIVPSTLSVVSCGIVVCDILKTLGVKLDSTLTFINHVNDIVKACTFDTFALHHLQRLVSRDVANSFTCSRVGSMIDYHTHCYPVPIMERSYNAHRTFW